jgi:hypothetical protein
MARIVTTEGNFENIEEFIQVDGQATADEIAEKPGLNRCSVYTVIHTDLRIKYC